MTTRAWRRTSAHSSSLTGAWSVRRPSSTTLFTAFHTSSTEGSITLFMTSRIDATGRNGGSVAGGCCSAGVDDEQPTSTDAAISTTAQTAGRGQKYFIKGTI